jgi:hypothetical protein
MALLFAKIRAKTRCDSQMAAKYTGTELRPPDPTPIEMPIENPGKAVYNENL